MKIRTKQLVLVLVLASACTYVSLYFSNTSLSFTSSPFSFTVSWRHDGRHHKKDQGSDNYSLEQLKKQVKVLIWVMTSPQNLDTKAKAVKDTWASRAEQVLFMSSQANSSFPAVGLNVSEGREHLTVKTMKAFTYVYQIYIHQYDWFMKVDDDTYVIVENLLHFLSDKNQSEPVYFGQPFKPFVKQGYNSGGAGYVLSKEALRRLCEKDDAERCIKTNTNEDVEMGRCLETLGVRIGESLDQFGKTRFHGLSLQTVFDTNCDKSYARYDYYNCTNKGWKWLSDYAITFHYISPINMLQLDYFIYRLRPYGVFNRLVV